MAVLDGVATVRGMAIMWVRDIRRGLGVAVVLVLALLACGCAGHESQLTAAKRHAASSPTATPMTAAELSWISAVTHLQNKLDKPFAARSMTMTRVKMTQLEAAMRGCSRELRRMGSPGTRLQPVYVIVKKACQTYDKSARCYARAASVSDASGATFAGTPQARIQRRSLTCGLATQGNGSNRLGAAIAQSQLIESRTP